MKLCNVSRMKVTLFILAKKMDNSTSFRKKIQLLDSKFEFAGGVANWYILGFELSIVNITTCCC